MSSRARRARRATALEMPSESATARRVPREGPSSSSPFEVVTCSSGSMARSVPPGGRAASEAGSVVPSEGVLASLLMASIEPQKVGRSEEHTSELQSRGHLVCRLLLEKKKKITQVRKAKQLST